MVLFINNSNLEIRLYTSASVEWKEKVNLDASSLQGKKLTKNCPHQMLLRSEILLVPNVKLMSKAIESHVEKHKKN